MRYFLQSRRVDFVDGDELEGLFPSMGNTHCSRGGEITGELAHLIYKGWMR